MATKHVEQVREVSPQEGVDILDRAAQQILGISGNEFLRRWDHGDYEDHQDPEVHSVAILIPFAR